jgi:hypothetical protein
MATDRFVMTPSGVCLYSDWRDAVLLDAICPAICKKADPEAADPRTSIHDFIPDCV